MGDGTLFLAVRAEIRKKIRKNAGDVIHVILYPDNEELELPDEMMLCLKDEPKVLRFFKSLSEREQKHYIDWIYSAKKDETKVERIAQTIDRILEGLRRYDNK